MIQALKRDLLGLLKSPFCLALILIPMPAITLLLHFALGNGILRDIPIGVVDFSASSTSRDLLFSIQASPSFKIHRSYTSIYAAQDDLQNARIYALLILPQELQANAKKGIPTSLPLYYNAQFLLVAKALQSKLTPIIGTQNVKLKLAKNLVSSKVFVGALSQSIPISQQITALYNPDSSYAQFLLTAILPCSWVILICALMLCLLIQDPRPANLLSKLFLNTTLSMLWWAWMMGFFSLVMGLPMRGDWSVMVLSALLVVLAYEGIVLFIYALARDATRSMSVISIYSAPSFAFAGITFPLNSMDGFARFWSDLLPISHYLQLYIHQANYGGSPKDALSLCAQLLPFCLFGLLGTILLLRGRR